jgi:hypothetical protein
MKKIVLSLLLFCAHATFAQSSTELNGVPLEKKEDYKPAESVVLSAANQVLSAPFNEDESYRRQAVSFIFRWMQGTPDYNFSFSANNLKPFNGNKDLWGMYIVSMAKFALENPDQATDEKAVDDGAMNIVIAYCKNPDNHLAMTKAMKKIANENKK